ncbi:hypothetical protein ABH975_006523 [Bradyrhizobium ottawaense]
MMPKVVEWCANESVLFIWLARYWMGGQTAQGASGCG